MSRCLAVVVVALVAACSSNPPGPPAAFPADWATTYTEVRTCRGPSPAHENENVRVLASPDALAPYQGRTLPFPTGAIVIKAQYVASDMDCARDIVEFTAMIKLADGAPADSLGWTWQTASPTREVLPEDPSVCTNCHVNCDGAGGGYLGTCEDP